jgi:hypothetical protein
MADDATRAIALERLMQRKDAKHKKELDRLHKRIRQLEAKTTSKGIVLTQEEAEELRWLIGDPEDHYGDPYHPLRTLKKKLINSS